MVDKSKQIAALNDQLRRTFLGGKVNMTRGIAALPEADQARILTAVREFKTFGTIDNDPYGEHDFGGVTVNGHKAFWKIDYYDRAMEKGSDDPADPAQTTRVLTIMLAEEY